MVLFPTALRLSTPIPALHSGENSLVLLFTVSSRRSVVHWLQHTRMAASVFVSQPRAPLRGKP